MNDQFFQQAMLDKLDRIARMIETATLPKLMYSREEVAQMIGVSLREVDRMTAAGEIPSRKIGSRRLYPRKELMAALGVEG